MAESVSIQTVQQLRSLEHQLGLKQMQIQRLLNITQGINENLTAEQLYTMYKEFLRFEMGMSKVLLMIKEDKDWKIVVDHNLDKVYDATILLPIVENFASLHTVKESDPEFLHEFDIVVPVYHKQSQKTIAYLLVTVANKDDLYNKIQFIQTITNIIAVAIENKRLFKTQVEQQRINKEIELAQEVQRLLIPQSLPKTKSFELSSIYQPHFNVGGDYFDCLSIDQDRYLICLADISGKGVSAALLMSNLQANLRQLIRQYTSLEKLVKELNQSVFNLSRGDRFLTLFVAEIVPTKGDIHYINCGHISPLLHTENTIHKLDTGTTVIGAFDKLPFIDHGHIQISKPGLLLIFTDGLTDLVNPAHEYFEIEHIESFLRENYKSSATIFNNHLMEELDRFKGNQTYPDDITVLTCKINPNAG